MGAIAHGIFQAGALEWGAIAHGILQAGALEWVPSPSPLPFTLTQVLKRMTHVLYMCFSNYLLICLSEIFNYLLT